MTEKRFTSDVDVFSLRKIICDNKTDREYFNEIDEYDKDIEKIILVLNEQHETIHSLKIENDELKRENEQLKSQIKIFEKFLNENNLDIDWKIFCTVDECKKDSEDYGCKECKYLGDVE